MRFATEKFSAANTESQSVVVHHQAVERVSALREGSNSHWSVLYFARDDSECYVPEPVLVEMQ